MNPNLKEKRKREFRALRERLSEIRKEQSKLGYIELESPYFLHYKAILIPRNDIQNRNDANIFWEISRCSSTCTAKTIKKFSWNNKKWKHTWLQEKPNLSRILEKDFKKFQLSDKAKRYFEKYEEVTKFGKRVYYSCILPSWYFEIYYKKVFRTQLKIESRELESEEAFIRGRLRSEYADLWWSDNHSTRWSRTAQNKAFRRKINIWLTNSDLESKLPPLPRSKWR